MPRVCWTAAPNGSYWLDVRLAGIDIELLVDTGFIDSFQRIGFSLEPDLYDRFKRAGSFAQIITDYRVDAGGHTTKRKSGLLSAQLLDPVTRVSIGPSIDLYTARGAPGIPSRVGLSFFHKLAGCRVYWDLDQRLWCIDHP